MFLVKVIVSSFDRKHSCSDQESTGHERTGEQ